MSGNTLSTRLSKKIKFVIFTSFIFLIFTTQSLFTEPSDMAFDSIPYGKNIDFVLGTLKGAGLKENKNLFLRYFPKELAKNTEGYKLSSKYAKRISAVYSDWKNVLQMDFYFYIEPLAPVPTPKEGEEEEAAPPPLAEESYLMVVRKTLKPKDSIEKSYKFYSKRMNKGLNLDIVNSKANFPGLLGQWDLYGNKIYLMTYERDAAASEKKSDDIPNLIDVIAASKAGNKGGAQSLYVHLESYKKYIDRLRKDARLYQIALEKSRRSKFERANWTADDF